MMINHRKIYISTTTTKKFSFSPVTSVTSCFKNFFVVVDLR